MIPTLSLVSCAAAPSDDDVIGPYTGTRHRFYFNAVCYLMKQF